MKEIATNFLTKYFKWNTFRNKFCRKYLQI